MGSEALLDPGDEVLLPAPFWPLIRGIIRKRGARAVEVPFFDKIHDDDFDAEAALEAAVTDRTAAIYVNTPHNPTGGILSDQDIAAIARVAERHDLWIFSELYRRFLDSLVRPTDEENEAISRAETAPAPAQTIAAGALPIVA